jgi:hypothetical protein
MRRTPVSARKGAASRGVITLRRSVPVAPWWIKTRPVVVPVDLVPIVTVDRRRGFAVGGNHA